MVERGARAARADPVALAEKAGAVRFIVVAAMADRRDRKGLPDLLVREQGTDKKAR
jgi:hypothetical protein